MQIRIGLISIECMTLNLYNSSYSYSALHQFSNCCRERVRLKKVCEGCKKELVNSEILKGTDKNTILSEEQQDQLKELLENSVIEILSFKDLEKDTLTNILPFINKSQIILPSIRKGFKKQDIIIFNSFKLALKEAKKYCIAKLVTRGKEHLCFIINFKNDLLLLELPFNYRNNKEEIERIKEAIERESRGLNLDKFKTEAKKFIEGFKNQFNSYTEIKEEKKQLLRTFIEAIKTGKPTKSVRDSKKVEINPFAISEKS